MSRFEVWKFFGFVLMFFWGFMVYGGLWGFGLLGGSCLVDLGRFSGLI